MSDKEPNPFYPRFGGSLPRREGGATTRIDIRATVKEKAWAKATAEEYGQSVTDFALGSMELADRVYRACKARGLTVDELLGDKP